MRATKHSKNQSGITASLPSSKSHPVADASNALTTPIRIIPAKIFPNKRRESEAVVANTQIAWSHPTNTPIHFSRKFPHLKSKRYDFIVPAVPCAPI